ncbi:unnamed protein product, partial [Ixodes hexagonus]
DSKSEKLSEDRILDDDGSFQWRVLVCSALSIVVYACQVFSLQLVSRVMNHWCLPPDSLDNMTLAQWMNASIPIEEDGSFSRCTIYDRQSTAINDSIRRIVSCGSWYFDLEQYGKTIISEWSLVCNRSWLVPLSSQVIYSGTVFCLPVLGMAADRIGRRPVVSASVVVLIITGCASALTKSFLFFVVVRFVVMASGGSLTTFLFVMLYEVTAPAKRVLYTTIYLAAAFIVSPIILIPLSLFQVDWMVIYLVLMMPTSFLVATFYMVQESPRWLLATWKLKAAEQVTLLAARTNKTSLDHALYCFNKALTRMRGSISDNDVPLTIALIGLLRQPKHQKNAVLLFYACFAIEFAYAVTVTTEHLVSYDWVPLVSLISSVPLFVGLYFCLVYYGRKKVTVVLIGLISVKTMVLMFTYCDGEPTLTASVVLLMQHMSCSAAYTAIYIFTMELFPTVFRCIGVGTAYACGSLGTLLAVQLTKFEATRLRKDLLLLLTAIVTMVGSLCLGMLPNTAGTVLFSRQQRSRTEADRKCALVASLAMKDTVSRKHSTRVKAHRRGSQALGPPSVSAVLPTQSVPADGMDLSQGTSISSKHE